MLKGPITIRTSSRAVIPVHIVSASPAPFDVCTPHNQDRPLGAHGDTSDTNSSYLATLECSWDESNENREVASSVLPPQTPADRLDSADTVLHAVL